LKSNHLPSPQILQLKTAGDEVIDPSTGWHGDTSTAAACPSVDISGQAYATTNGDTILVDIDGASGISYGTESVTVSEACRNCSSLRE